MKRLYVTVTYILKNFIFSYVSNITCLWKTSLLVFIQESRFLPLLNSTIFYVFCDIFMFESMLLPNPGFSKQEGRRGYRENISTVSMVWFESSTHHFLSRSVDENIATWPHQFSKEAVKCYITEHPYTWLLLY